MQLKFFTIPLYAGEAEADLNKFLRSVKVIDIRRELVMTSESACWSICVLYMPHAGTHPAAEFSASAQAKTFSGKGRIDYREVLPPEEFALFSELRNIRKQIAEADSVPPYVVFTDAELAEIVRAHECTPQSLIKIKGIGANKVEKYGIRFCEMALPIFYPEIAVTATDEESGSPF